jgi:hypothetical protein
LIGTAAANGSIINVKQQTLGRIGVDGSASRH